MSKLLRTSPKFSACQTIRSLSSGLPHLSGGTPTNNDKLSQKDAKEPGTEALKADNDPKKGFRADSQSSNKPADTQQETKSQQQLDDELRARMAGLTDAGGEASLELENGKPVSMKRSVKNNMFRYI